MSPNPQPIKAGGDRPLYRQISDTLLAGIRDGLFPVGTLLPGELDLIGRYGTSRHTVREALRVLEDMGIVKRERGRGTLVISTEARPAFVQSVKDPRELFSYPKNSKFRVLSEGKIGDNDVWPSKMGSDISEQWARISGLRTLSDGRPFCWTDVFVLPAYADIAQQLDVRGAPVYEQIAEKYGETVEKISLEICAGLLTGARAEALQVPDGTPSLVLYRRYCGNGGRLFEVSVTEHPADTFSYALEFNRGWQAAEHWSWSK